MKSLIKKYTHKVWRKVVPEVFRKKKYYYRDLHGAYNEFFLKSKVQEVRLKKPIKVLFISVNLPMWRAQGVFDLLKADTRFDPRIVITSFCYYSHKESLRQSEPLKKYFQKKNISFVSTLDEGFNINEWHNSFNPDIIFTCQPYDRIYGNILDPNLNMDKLNVYIPYGLTTGNHEINNSSFHNLAWRIYCPTPLHFKGLKKLMANNAKNVKIVGEPDYDKLQLSNVDPWKQMLDGKKRKRIIWAPHFSIAKSSFLSRTSFNWLCDAMVEIAIEYSDRVQIAFKPHPNLYNKMRNLPQWGPERTDEYFNKWNEMPNTQLEEGDFLSLFKYSDAMIHDCDSFTGEYLMVNKPVMFVTREEKKIIEECNEFGKRCLNCHYFGHNIEDVKRFIENTVIDGEDPLEEIRKELLNNIIPNGKSVANNIYSDLLISLGLEDI